MVTTAASYSKSDARVAVTELRRLEERHAKRSADRRAREDQKRRQLAHELMAEARRGLIPAGERVT